MTPEEVKNFESYRVKARFGGADAQRRLGFCYDKGDGVAKDMVEAMKWYRKAAEQGDAKAQCNIGNLYYRGEGVAKDQAQAVTWWRKAAEQGYANAQYILGLVLLGDDDKQAEVWLCKAAEQGDVDAQLQLGEVYSSGGFGVLQNTEQGLARRFKASEQGFAWYLRAAEQGSAEGQHRVGELYFVGGGVDRDHAKSIPWFRKAMEQGYINAHHWLAGCYLRGEGVPKDTVEAYAIYNLAGVTDSLARSRLAELEGGMSKDEIAAGQKRTRELKKEIEANVAAKRVAASAVSTTTGDVDSKPQVEIATRRAPIDNDITNAPWLLLALACVIIGVLMAGLMFKNNSAAVGAASSDNSKPDTKPASRGFFFYWAASSLAILTFLAALGYLNAGASGFAFQLGRGLILAPIAGLVVGGIWKMMSK